MFVQSDHEICSLNFWTVGNNLFLGFWTSKSIHGFRQGDYMAVYAALGEWGNVALIDGDDAQADLKFRCGAGRFPVYPQFHLRVRQRSSIPCFKPR